MRRTYTFDVAEHAEYGTIGFRPTWYKAGDPLGGMAVAHDILEHFAGDDSRAEGEYQALGASLWIRGDGGYWSNSMYTPEEQIASDFDMIWRIQPYVRQAPRIRDEDLRERCRTAVQHAVQNMRDNGWESADMPTALDREHMARWLARGYKRAQRRYKAHSPYLVAWDLFKPIEEAADKALTYAEQGMVLTVRVDYAIRQVWTDCTYPEQADY